MLDIFVWFCISLLNKVLKILTLSVNKNIDNVFYSGYIINGNILLK